MACEKVHAQYHKIAMYKAFSSSVDNKTPLNAILLLHQMHPKVMKTSMIPDTLNRTTPFEKFAQTLKVRMLNKS
jgi:hypothetical protein